MAYGRALYASVSLALLLGGCGHAISVAQPKPSSQTTSKSALSEPAPQQMVDALYTAFGDNHSRAVHAKGLLVEGFFEPSPQASSLSSAILFRSNRIPVLARFSNFTGIPTIPDNVGDANPRGLALKFMLPDKSTADIVTHSFNGFPTATAGEFRELLLAIGDAHAGESRAMDSFLASHPIAKTFLTTQKPAPASYGTLSYFGVNSFAFTSTEGRKTFVRYRFTPATGEKFIGAEEAAAKGPDYLQQELPKRLANGPLAFEWYAQIAYASDAIDDPSIAWPETRRLIRLGIIHLERPVKDQAASDRSTAFEPLNLPDGIEGADPMLTIRNGAYPLSFVHRQ